MLLLEGATLGRCYSWKVEVVGATLRELKLGATLREFEDVGATLREFEDVGVTLREFEDVGGTLREFTRCYS